MTATAKRHEVRRIVYASLAGRHNVMGDEILTLAAVHAGSIPVLHVAGELAPLLRPE